MIRVSELIYNTISGIISIIVINIGIIMIKEFKEKPLIGFLVIILGFILFYFSFYTSQIKNNQDEINDIKESIQKFEERLENQEKLLNTIKDIILLKKK